MLGELCAAKRFALRPVTSSNHCAEEHMQVGGIIQATRLQYASLAGYCQGIGPLIWKWKLTAFDLTTKSKFLVRDAAKPTL